jgi:hypothetical protein
MRYLIDKGRWKEIGLTSEKWAEVIEGLLEVENTRSRPR